MASFPPPGVIPDPPVILTALLAVLLPFVPADLNSPSMHGAKSLGFELGAAVLLGLAPWFRRRPHPTEGRKIVSGPFLFFALLALWSFVSSMISPDKTIAFNGWWLLVGGLVIAFTVATGTRSEGESLFVLDALTVASVVIASATFLLYQSGGMKVAEGTYHDHQLLGAALMILTPITLTGVCRRCSAARKTWAAAAFVLCASGLMLSQDRSGWLGEAAALSVFGSLSLWIHRIVPKSNASWRRSGRQGSQAVVTAILILVALGYFVIASQQSDLMRGRARTITTTVLTGQDDSVQWRLDTWDAALRMISVKPVLGWGVGSFPLYEQQFTGRGDSEGAVRAGDAHIGDETHNSYLQLAVELGVPGLLLFVLGLGAAFWNGLRSLRRQANGDPLRQWVLIGSLSALAGQAVDAFANPAWQFGEIMLYFWIILGLVVSASKPRDVVGDQETFPIALRLAVSAASVWIIAESIAAARDLPIPHL